MTFVDLQFSNTAVKNLEPLRRISVKHLRVPQDAADADILAAIANLETINGQPAQDFIAKLKNKSLPRQ
jgi:hypothetical protein